MGEQPGAGSECMHALRGPARDPVNTSPATQAAPAPAPAHHDGPRQALVAGLHVSEGVSLAARQVAHEVHIGLHPPVPVKPLQQRVVEEEAAEVSAVPAAAQDGAARPVSAVGRALSRKAGGHPRGRHTAARQYGRRQGPPRLEAALRPGRHNTSGVRAPAHETVTLAAAVGHSAPCRLPQLRGAADVDVGRVAPVLLRHQPKEAGRGSGRRHRGAELKREGPVI